MTNAQGGAAPAGWYADPYGQQALRWWNGVQWTQDTAPVPGVVSAPGVVGEVSAGGAPAVAPPVEGRGGTSFGQQPLVRDSLGFASEEDKGRSWWSRSMTSIHGEPLPYLSKATVNIFRVSSGIGVVFATLVMWALGAVFLCAHLLNAANPTWIAWFSIVPFVFAAFFDYQGVRRMVWEHRNGGIWRRSKTDVIVWGLIVVIVAGYFLIKFIA